MTPRGNLPSLSLNDAPWPEAPPDALSAPDLYDGIIWRRSLGFLVDLALNGLLYSVLGVVFWLAGVLTFGLLWPLGVAALAILPFAYHTFFIGRQGATPGMALFDAEVRTWTGERPDYARAFLMTAMFYASIAATSGLILAVSLFNDRRRTLHDYLAGTVVVRHSRLAGPGA